MYLTFYSINIFNIKSELVEVVYKICIKIGVKVLHLNKSLYIYKTKLYTLCSDRNQTKKFM
jgi:hypothetical protein